MPEPSLSTAEVWERFHLRLQSFFQLRVSDKQIAEDLLQETFLRIHRNLQHVDDGQRIAAWVFQIARNLLIDHYRSFARAASTVTDEVESGSVEEDNLNSLVTEWIYATITQLPDAYRDAVELYEIQRMPQQQIADSLGVSLSGAKSRVQRGRARLRSLLLDCCSFEQDRRGNIIGYTRNSADSCDACQGDCEP